MSDLLAACPHVRGLVTSRSALRVRAEQRFAVPPLATPAARRGPLRTETTAFAAVELFVERARVVQPTFALTTENAETVAEICRRLDGMPLAIELVAARIGLLSPSALLARLERRLDLLRGGPGDLPDRQKTLRGAIDWSYRLLEPHEQRLFARLGLVQQ